MTKWTNKVKVENWKKGYRLYCFKVYLTALLTLQSNITFVPFGPIISMIPITTLKSSQIWIVGFMDNVSLELLNVHL